MIATCEDHEPALLPDTWLIAALALIAGVGVVQAYALPTNGDVAWLLYVAGRILDGARPYVDVVETNPPWILVLNLGFVGLSRLVGLGPSHGLLLAVFALIGLSLSLTWRLSRGLPGALRRVGILTWAYLLLAHIGAMFAQREHLLEILILPYVFGAIAEARGDRPPRGLAVLAGLMAGVGFALKPYFVPALIAIEVYLAWQRGVQVWRRPQLLAIATVFAVYAVVLLVWFRDFFVAARDFAPLYLRYELANVFGHGNQWRVPLGLLAIVFARVLSRDRVPHWANVFGLLAGALTLAVVLGGRGWLYHWLVVAAITIYLLAGVVALILAEKSGALQRRVSVALAIAAPAFAGLGLFEVRSLLTVDDAAIAIVRQYAGDHRGSVLVLSGQPDVAMVVDNRADWGMRHPFLWPLRSFYTKENWRPGGYHPVVTMSPAERRFVGEVAQDFERNRPVLVLIDARIDEGAFADFDYLDYMKVEPRFEQNFRDYEFLAATTLFRAYRRRDDDPASRSIVASQPERSTTVTELSDIASAATIGP